MTRFMTDTLTDIRRGQQSWRVFVALCTPAFAVTVLVLTIRGIA